MWMRKATNVTNESISADSGSSRKEMSIERFATAIQLVTGSTTTACDPAKNGIRREYAARVASPAAPQPTADTKDLPSRVPSSPFRTKPSSGIAGITQSGSVVMREPASPLEEVDLVHVDRLRVAEEGDEDREAHG